MLRGISFLTHPKSNRLSWVCNFPYRRLSIRANDGSVVLFSTTAQCHPACQRRSCKNEKSLHNLIRLARYSLLGDGPNPSNPVLTHIFPQRLILHGIMEFLMKLISSIGCFFSETSVKQVYLRRLEWKTLYIPSLFLGLVPKQKSPSMRLTHRGDTGRTSPCQSLF